MSVQLTPFGDGANLFTLEAGGVRAQVTDYGAALVSLRHPDGTGLVLGFDDVSGYQRDESFRGVIAGRYANRIAEGRLTLGGKTWVLPCNNGRNHLHGGPEGFGKRFWQAEMDEAAAAVRFLLISPHLDQGYPGEVTAAVRYAIEDDGRLTLTLSARADRPTVVNLTPHGYFNLAGADDIASHLLRLHCSTFTPVDGDLIPTGEIAEVAGTPFDFRAPRPFPPEIDLNFAVDGEPGTLRPVAEVRDPRSGRTLVVRATAPGVQVYGGGGSGGFCVEPQYFPDSPNQPAFAAPVVDPDHPYEETVEYRLQ